MNEVQLQEFGAIAGRSLRNKQERDIRMLFIAQEHQTAMSKAYWGQIPYSFWPRKLSRWQRFVNWIKGSR